ncbi:hypothetical protein BU23DRAFT_625629 [Bimuria novae-zelandiae CBS 107.79]|uniref:Fungal N-terminal domain-containing protein n=1 Tax=Bimuria novae-zelandiae CBS 107.79 TaxID=1447943 RepID=A0A6A5VSW9_9PLEO|nr:hypothetical protein BU23DRAFT_625629 [Bimuria novae-zelandiae CBS 107.79]
MAGPLSAIAGIVGVAAASAQLANAIYRICEKAKHGPQDMKQVAANMTSLSFILEDVAYIIGIAKDKAVYKPRVLQEIKSALERFRFTSRCSVFCEIASTRANTSSICYTSLP